MRRMITVCMAAILLVVTVPPGSDVAAPPGEGHEGIQRLGHIQGVAYILPKSKYWGLQISRCLPDTRSVSSDLYRLQNARMTFEVVKEDPQAFLDPQFRNLFDYCGVSNPPKGFETVNEVIALRSRRRAS